MDTNCFLTPASVSLFCRSWYFLGFYYFVTVPLRASTPKIHEASFWEERLCCEASRQEARRRGHRGLKGEEGRAGERKCGRRSSRSSPFRGEGPGEGVLSPLWLWVSLGVSSVCMLGRVTCMTYKDIAVSWKQDSASLSWFLGYRGGFMWVLGPTTRCSPSFVCSMGSGAGTPRPTPSHPVPQRVHRQLGGGSRPGPAPLLWAGPEEMFRLRRLAALWKVLLCCG